MHKVKLLTGHQNVEAFQRMINAALLTLQENKAEIISVQIIQAGIGYSIVIALIHYKE